MIEGAEESRRDMQEGDRYIDEKVRLTLSTMFVPYIDWCRKVNLSPQ